MKAYYLDNTQQRTDSLGDRTITPQIAPVIESWNDTPGGRRGRWKLCWRSHDSSPSHVILRVTGQPELHTQLRARSVFLGADIQEAINRLGDRLITRHTRLIEQRDEPGDTDP